MIILLVVKPKRHSSQPTSTPDTPAVEEGPVARPLQELEPDGSPLEGLGSLEDGAPFRILR